MSQPVVSTVSLHPYSPEFQQGVVDLILPIQQQEFDIPVTLADQPDLLDIPNFYQHGTGNFWVAVVDGQVVGSISLLDIGNGQTALRKMFVHADWRGRERAVAQQLLQHLVQQARLQGVRDIFLGTTAKFLAAHRFYEKHGFLLIDKAELPARFPVMQVDTRFYHLPLAASAV
ncbi:GNAT family N-acetyltransferase [Pokkaliibacter plantistimulans]|uniref:GNAT family N-acetyltransferase n=1 Tax=Proteobacteria bacterium 228 TaxID=2083153 RepID=A0A2S5KTN0_9PROT|nr:GNAT family N-acetyltransferase [Pokkaliibacter plantistimulans]PPC78214.1 GNAT family N-acetyltransferase [Pokkaliibacter plantistimulans]